MGNAQQDEVTSKGLSPNSLANLTQAQTNVNLYTGKLSLSFPLYTLPGRQFSFPLALHYDGGGVKVNQPEGYFGMSFSMNPGSITRVVKGVPDDQPNGFCSEAGIKMQSVTEATVSSLKFIDEPDVFFFSLPNGESGSFVLTPTGEPMLMPYKELTIQPGIGAMKTLEDQWIITDTQGNQYVFGKRDMNHTGAVEKKIVELPEEAWRTDRYSGSPIESTTQEYTVSTTWHLTKMQSLLHQDEITLTYGADRGVFYSESPAYVSINKSSRYLDYNRTPSKSVAPYMQNVKIGNLYLSKITSSLGEIRLIAELGAGYDYGGSTSSVSSRTKYTGIEVYNYLGQKIKDYRFSYAERKGCGEVEGGNTTCLTRFFLDKVEEFDMEGNYATKLYQFFYNNPSLPPRNTLSVDKWGYYGSNDGSFSETKVQAGVLKQVVYGTGLNLGLTYEAHQTETGELLTGGLRVKSVTKWSGIDGSFPLTTDYSYEKGVAAPQVPYIRQNLLTELSYREYWEEVITRFDNGNPIIENILKHSYVSISDAFSSGKTERGLQLPENALHNNMVGYGKVIVQQSGKGKLVYHYSNFDEYPDINSEAWKIYSSCPVNEYVPERFISSRHWKRGVLTLKEMYDEAGEKFSETSYSYEWDAPIKNQITAFHTEGVFMNLKPYHLGANIDGMAESCVIYKTNYISQVFRIKGTTTKEWDERGESVAQYSELTYDNEYPTIAYKSKSTDFQGVSVEKEYTFPFHFDDIHMRVDDPIAQMKRLRIIRPIETITKRDGWIVGASLNLPKKGNLLPNYFYTLKKEKALTLAEFNPLYFNRTLDLSFDAKYILNQEVVYDDFGQTVWQRDRAGIESGILWNYHQNLPIASVINVSPSSVRYDSFEEEPLQNTILSSGSILTNAEDAPTGNKVLKLSKYTVLVSETTEYRVKFWAKADGFSTGTFAGIIKVAGTGLAIASGWQPYEIVVTPEQGRIRFETTDAEVYIDQVVCIPTAGRVTSTYTYKPLVGVTTRTDLNNQIIRFGYDARGRKLFEKDQEGNLLNTYEYLEKTY